MIIQSILQGIMEFFPISSSFNLKLLGLNTYQIGFLHLASIPAILVFYRKYINFKIFKPIIVSLLGTSISFIIIQIIFNKSNLELEILSLNFSVFLLFINGLIIFSTKYFNSKKNIDQISILASFIIGFMQGIAILPGLSRLGLSVSACIWSGFKTKDSIIYSFLLYIPSILIGTVLNIKRYNFSIWPYLILTIFISFIGLFLLNYIVKYFKFYVFSFYSFLVVFSYIIYNYIYM